MPHPQYTLHRDLAAALARIPQAAHYMISWYQSGNHDQAATALRTASIHALRATGDDALTPQERESVGRMLADLEALR